MNTHDQLWLGARWQDVVLALLPGLFVIAQRSGLLQRLGGPYSLFGNDDAVLVLCLALVLVSWLRERRFAVWSYPALGMALAIGLMTISGAISALAQTIALSDSIAPLALTATVWGAIFVFAFHYRLFSAVPRPTWIPLAALSGVYVLLYHAVFLGMCLLPVLIAYRLARQNRITVALVILASEFVFLDTIFDPGYAIGMWTRDPTLPQVLDILPAVGFLLVSPLWVLLARSFRDQVIGLLLPPSLALAIAELLSGWLRPYYTPALRLNRGLGASEFMLMVALAVLIYHAALNDGARPENDLQPAQAAT